MKNETTEYCRMCGCLPGTNHGIPCVIPPSDTEVFNAMKAMGGSFVKALGEAGLHADLENVQTIKSAFADYWADYSGKALWLRARAKDNG